MDIVILIGQIILIFAYAIGVLIVIKNQKGEIKKLKTQIETQSGILSAMEKFMGIFKLEEIERYVEMSRKTFLMEKEDDMKAFKEKLEATTKKSYNFLFKEYLDVSKTLNRLSFAFGSYPYFEKTILEMESVVVKESLLESIKEQKEALKAQGIDAGMWTPLIVQAAYMQSISEQKENQTPSEKKEK